MNLVLIETLWNVKIENYDRMEDWTGINRNIVECKGDCGSESFVRVPCINRNIVECKVEVYNVTDLVRLRINRNIVECKDSFFDCPLVPLLVLIETLWNVKSGLL